MFFGGGFIIKRNITRKGFVCLGIFMIGTFFVSLKKTPESKNNNENIFFENINDKQVSTQDINTLRETTNKKEYDAYEHYIYEVLPLEVIDEIEIPDGYMLIDTSVCGEDKNKVKNTFVNTVPVKATKYVNSLTNEVSCPYAGVPIDYEKYRLVKIA